MYQMDLSGLQINFGTIMPEMILAAFGILVLLVGVFSSTREGGRDHLGYISLVGVVLALIFTFRLRGEVQYGFSDMVVVDGFSFFFKIVFGIICLLTILVSIGYARREGIGVGEYYALVLFSTIGMMFMASGTNLLNLSMFLQGLSETTPGPSSRP
jgi:NADH-quinone oxidoreductase subunit N